MHVHCEIRKYAYWNKLSAYMAKNMILSILESLESRHCIIVISYISLIIKVYRFHRLRKRQKSGNTYSLVARIKKKHICQGNKV